MAEIRLESNPPDKKRCHGHVGHELPLDSIGDEVAHPAGRGGEVVGVVVVLKPPVAVQGQAGGLGLIDSVLAGQQLPHILKYAAARRAPGPSSSTSARPLASTRGGTAGCASRVFSSLPNISESSACV